MEPLLHMLIVYLVITIVKLVMHLHLIVQIVFGQELTHLDVFAHQNNTKNQTLLVIIVNSLVKNV